MSSVNTKHSALTEKESVKVAVIGTGLAGLTAAYRLQKEGMEVDLYEARSRVGGRVFTIIVDGNVAELGAQNITDGGEASHLFRLINEFDLELTASRINLNHSYFHGKDLIPVNQLLRNKQFHPEALRNQLNTLVSTAHNMKEILKGILKESDPLYHVIAVRLAAYEGAPLEKLSPVYAETLYHMLLGGICSVHQGEGKDENYVDLVSIKGGNSLLTEKMAQAHGARLHLNRVLTKVSKSEDGSFTLTFHEGREVKTGILILAIPCSVYENIIFEASVIPSDRLKGIQSVQYGTNAKILVPFSTIPSKRVGLVSDQIVSFFDATCSILTVYYTGKTSFFTHESILNAYFQARPMMEMGFENGCPPFITPIFAKDQSFVAYDAPVGYSWPNDPYAKGSYSYIAPGQETLLSAVTEENGEKFKTLFAPIEQTLYFVGEHATLLGEVPGTMEAACESGERIARAILKSRKIVSGLNSG